MNYVSLQARVPINDGTLRVSKKTLEHLCREYIVDTFVGPDGIRVYFWQGIRVIPVEDAGAS